MYLPGREVLPACNQKSPAAGFWLMGYRKQTSFINEDNWLNGNYLLKIVVETVSVCFIILESFSSEVIFTNVGLLKVTIAN